MTDMTKWPRKGELLKACGRQLEKRRIDAFGNHRVQLPGLRLPTLLCVLAEAPWWLQTHLAALIHLREFNHPGGWRLSTQIDATRFLEWPFRPYSPCSSPESEIGRKGEGKLNSLGGTEE